MKPSSKPQNEAQKSASDQDMDFVLPDAPDFISRTHPMTPNELFLLNQPFVEAFNSLPDAEERRLRTKCGVEFRYD